MVKTGFRGERKRN